MELIEMLPELEKAMKAAGLTPEDLIPLVNAVKRDTCECGHKAGGPGKCACGEEDAYRASVNAGLYGKLLREEHGLSK